MVNKIKGIRVKSNMGSGELPLAHTAFNPLMGLPAQGKGWGLGSFDGIRGEFESLNPKYETIIKPSNSNDQNRF